MVNAEGSNKKMIILKSSNGDEFEVEEIVAMVSPTIRHLIENGINENGIPLPKVNSKILSKVIEYCNKHVQENPVIDVVAGDVGASSTVAPVMAAEDLKYWDADFVKVDKGTLFDLIQAASDLNINGLLRLTCQTVLDMMRGKTPEELRKIFNMKSKYTPQEEEDEIRWPNQWAFE